MVRRSRRSSRSARRPKTMRTKRGVSMAPGDAQSTMSPTTDGTVTAASTTLPSVLKSGPSAQALARSSKV
eukprot:scaffold23366_cov112-Isochrysis_galbana.AAC.2